MQWNLEEDWWGCKASAEIGDLTAKVVHLIGQPIVFSVLDDDKQLVKGTADDWTSGLRRAQTATALLLKAKKKNNSENQDCSGSENYRYREA